MRVITFLGLAALLLAKSTVDRLDTAHLAAVHAQRVEWMRIRAIAHSPAGVYQDFRAVVPLHIEGNKRADVLRAAKDAEVRVVMLAGRSDAKSETWSGFHKGVLFISGSGDDHVLHYPVSPAGPELRFLTGLEESPAGVQGVEIYDRLKGMNQDVMDYFQSAAKDPKEWKRLMIKEKAFPDEVFAAGTGVLPPFIAHWDRDLAAHPFTGIATNESRMIKGIDFDPYVVAFRHVSTHILAPELSERAIRESLAAGRAYVSHDWLCDPTGFSFTAQDNLGIFEMGDQLPLTGFGPGAATLHALLPISAKVKLIRNGEVVAEDQTAKFSYEPKQPGAYRLEAWLNVDGEDRPWIYSNAIYIADSRNLMLPTGAMAPNVEVRKDISYTEGEPADAAKHKLDLYLPTNKKNFPVLVFMHGGSWRNGDRSNYPLLGNRFAKMGVGVVIPSYRLMPDNPHPAQIEDTAAAFAWVYRNIAEYGGDASRIYISGHSAGGHLVALLALDPKYLNKFEIPLTSIKGVAAISGVYDVSKLDAFAGATDNPSPLAHVRPKAPPFLISYCQWDYLALPLQARQLADALKKSFDPVELLYVPGESHISEIIHVIRDDDVIAQAILKLIQ